MRKDGDDKAEHESATASEVAVRARKEAPSENRSVNLEHHRRPVKPPPFSSSPPPNPIAGREFGNDYVLGKLGKAFRKTFRSSLLHVRNRAIGKPNGSR